MSLTAPTSRTSSPTQVRLDRFILGCCGLFVVLTVWACLVPRGEQLPVIPQMLLALTLVVMVAGHMAKHLGMRVMVAYLVLAAAVEWAFEQANISWDGFVWGDIEYGNDAVLGPHVGSVPIGVPVMMAVILWPTFVSVNLLLDSRVVSDPRRLTTAQKLWRCLLYGMVHSWYMFLCNSLAIEEGIYRWVGRTLELPAGDTFFGDPSAPRGWAIYVIVVMVPFLFLVLPRAGAERLDRIDVRPLVWADASPILFLGGMATMIYVNPVDRTTGNVVFWTIGFFSLLTACRFVDLMRAQRTASSRSDGQLVSADGRTD